MECYVSDKHRPTFQATRGTIGRNLTWTTLGPDTTIGCDRCPRPIAGTVVAVTGTETVRVHVGCVTAEEMSHRHGTSMHSLTAGERRKLSGIKTTPIAPAKHKTVGKPWVKALDAAAKVPTFRLETFDHSAQLDTDLKRALAFAGAVNASVRSMA